MNIITIMTNVSNYDKYYNFSFRISINRLLIYQYHYGKLSFLPSRYATIFYNRALKLTIYDLLDLDINIVIKKNNIQYKISRENMIEAWNRL